MEKKRFGFYVGENKTEKKKILPKNLTSWAILWTREILENQIFF